MIDSDTQRTTEALDRADILERAGDFPGAIAELTAAIAVDSTNARLRAHRGRLFQLREQWEEALQDFDTALHIRPDAVTTRFFRARAKSMLGDLEGALRDFAECARLDPNAADAPYESALIHEYRGELKEALEALERAIDLADGEFRDTRDRIADLRQRLATP